jgi:hypothetical protein
MTVDEGQITEDSFEDLSDLLSEVRHADVVDEAEESWTGQGGKAGKPTESAFRYRWNTQEGYLRDLAIYSLRSRLASPDQAGKAARLLFGSAADAWHL